ncbi:hypothetical protein pb186bvf_007362 [Paramecium bursaria]
MIYIDKNILYNQDIGNIIYVFLGVQFQKTDQLMINIEIYSSNSQLLNGKI